MAVKKEEEDLGSMQAIIDVINFNEDAKRFQKYFIRSIFRLKSPKPQTSFSSINFKVWQRKKGEFFAIFERFIV